jgi:regulator of CtrA degradation
MHKSATLLDRTFDEGVALTLEARNYIAYHENRGPDLNCRLHYGYQHTRVSARLIQIMTWLLAMKALLAGEISPEQFVAPQYAMVVSDECESEMGPELGELPPGLRSLLERSHSLYARILRLDNMVKDKLEAGEVPNFAMLTGPAIIQSGADA